MPPDGAAVRVIDSPSSIVGADGEIKPAEREATTVNVAFALLVPSLTVTLLGPKEKVEGTAKVQPGLTLPEESVEQVGGIPVLENSKVTLRGLLTKNPVPLMVTLTPIGPEDGLRLTDVDEAKTGCGDKARANPRTTNRRRAAHGSIRSLLKSVQLIWGRAINDISTDYIRMV